MSKGMLGELPLSEVRGPKSTLDERLAGDDGREWLAEFKRFLRREPCWVDSSRHPTRSWNEGNGVIDFSVETDNTTGEEWITRLESKGFRVGDYAKQVLRSKDFKPTNGLTIEVAVLKGTLFDDQSRTTSKICAEADKRKFFKPNAELACLIREKFTDKEIEAMGLRYIVVMHEPINDSLDDLNLLCVDRYDDGRWLGTCNGRLAYRWRRVHGFAFARLQIRV